MELPGKKEAVCTRISAGILSKIEVSLSSSACTEGVISFSCTGESCSGGEVGLKLERSESMALGKVLSSLQWLLLCRFQPGAGSWKRYEDNQEGV